VGLWEPAAQERNQREFNGVTTYGWPGAGIASERSVGMSSEGQAQVKDWSTSIWRMRHPPP